MIDCSDIPNWERWNAKEQRGCNRGYDQAYRNTSRNNHHVLINTREYEYNNTARVTLTAHTTDTRNNNVSDDDIEETYEGALDTSLETAELTAREWMLSHPCERDGPRDDIELITDLLAELTKQGLTPQHDTNIHGWTRPERRDSTTFNIRPFKSNDTDDEFVGCNDPRNADIISFAIRIDGKFSGISYREYRETDSSGETRTFHEPTNQTVICPDIEAAFRAVGFKDIHVKTSGYQTHWDYATNYSVRVAIPTGFDLELPEPSSTGRTRRRAF